MDCEHFLSSLKNKYYGCIPPLFIIPAANLGLKHSYFWSTTFRSLAQAPYTPTTLQILWDKAQCKSLPFFPDKDISHKT